MTITFSPAMITDNRTLTEFLSELDSPRDDWYLYVAPDNVDDWRMGYYKFHHGNRIEVGPLSCISFARQDKNEALLTVLHKQYGRAVGWFEFQGKNPFVNVARIVELYGTGRLAPEFELALTVAVEQTCKEWALKNAQSFVEKVLPYHIYEQQSKSTEPAESTSVRLTA